MSKESAETDFIIVGQGLAGSLLAYLLLQRGKKVQIFDAPEIPSSSRVAAGIFNPVTGRKLVKTWMADELFPFLEQFYLELEDVLQVKFFHQVPIYRPFPNEEVQEYFKSDKVPEDFADFATIEFENIAYQDLVNSQLGGVTTKQSGWVDLKILLDAFRDFFRQKGVLFQENFNPESALSNNCKTIFCEGFQARSNPYFNYLPFNPVKGEVLEVTIEDITLDNIINQGAFVVPLSQNTFRLGATYSWHELDFIPTHQGKEDLLMKYHKLMKPNLEVIGHLAGVRPATKDRRPFIGIHPDFPQIGIFNGLGSKGVSLAPYFATQFTEFLLFGKELSPEVNINRFTSLYLRAGNS
ncbi:MULTISPECIES: FAD-binding oxidoreductase [unclassified Arcicella]|uniref:NAD(P)/FAD-dependent oxidoreductase n=1 Tax=unclassified Arcicella TaxID=2644986 RepID=UPI00285DC4E3|nr:MULTISPECIES: FAD-binding oxidoreductase [unclassified Arcicella]MDR6560849.1 glycine/D-amino acid oxidase-like deaminating enzyme [Arcicella sp. BE51]MDR6810733.1 glycine/D-amino acid oxidase-like deaminating enzyme [Arcicella sp. BE140]MDR6822083.1 glycine/D-amino acid oxidase-like deaminating enzyme [Arcicella sp. BE139]